MTILEAFLAGIDQDSHLVDGVPLHPDPVEDERFEKFLTGLCGFDTDNPGQEEDMFDADGKYIPVGTVTGR